MPYICVFSVRILKRLPRACHDSPNFHLQFQPQGHAVHSAATSHMNHNASKNPIIADIALPTVEDVVDYRIYIFPHLSSISEYQARLETILLHVRTEIIKDYIWQEEPFSLSLIEGLESSSLEPVTSLSSSASPTGQAFHFFGSTRFGDNIEDEWFIVHILQCISRMFSDIFISVVDSDGEFLLIEAAMHIPNWLKPETAIHRVWIAQSGEFHIIPLDKVPHLGNTHSTAITTAVSTIMKHPNETRVSSTITKCLQKRILGSVASNQPQWSACTVPLNVAYLLKSRPAWVAKAVTAFYHRDPFSQKTGQKFARFGTTPKVNMMVRFTRCLYAQASSQHWIPPKAYGNAEEIQNTPLLSRKIAFDLGAKLSLGFEILYHEEAERRKRMASTQALNSYPFSKDADWQNYKNKLNTIGYFRGLPETHIKYAELERRAKQKYLALHPDKALATLPPGVNQEIDELFQNIEISSEKNATPSISPSSLNPSLFPDSDLFPSSSTEWMNISQDELDRILFERQMEQEQLFKAQARAATGSKAGFTSQGNSTSESKADLGSDTEEDGEKVSHRKADVFDRMVQDIEKFLVMKSGVDGVDLSGEDEQNNEAKREPHEADPKPSQGTFGLDDGFDSDEFYETDSDEDKVDLEDLGPMEEDGKWPDLDKTQAGGDERMDRLAMLELMRAMDSQLFETEVAKSFERHSTTKSSETKDDQFADEHDIDANLNLVKNFIESYAAQNGVAGPVSTLLTQLEDWRKRQHDFDNEEAEP